MRAIQYVYTPRRAWLDLCGEEAATADALVASAVTPKGRDEERWTGSISDAVLVPLAWVAAGAGAARLTHGCALGAHNLTEGLTLMF